MTNNDWQLPKNEKEKLKIIKDYLKVSDLIASILLNRGIDSIPKIKEFVNPNILNLLNPFLFNDMEKSVLRIVESINNKKGILIFGDRDVDGVTATALLHRFINKMGGNVVYKVPDKDENYGITKKVIEYASVNDFDLIITVDCGITSIEEINYANSLKLDVIITDHHEPRNMLPNAYAIINPKVNNERFPFKNLCGAGVAFKLIQGIAEYYCLCDYFNQEIVFVDLETTGMIPGKDEIIEIGAVKVKNGIVIDEFQTLVIPKNPISEKITQINHITNEMVREQGIPLKLALQKFVDFVGDKKLIGHNIIDFDLKFLNFYLKKELGIHLNNPIEDTLRLARILLKKVKDHSLNTVAQYLCIYEDPNKLHRGIVDSKICAEIYRRLLIFRNQKIKEIYQECLPLVAIGTISDVMPLVEENRNIVKNGLKLAQNSIVGLITLMKSINLNLEKITTKDVSWILSPLLNSPGRIGDASLSVELLIATKIKEAEGLVNDIINSNKERKNLSDSGIEYASSLFDKEVAKSNKIIFISSDKIIKGTTGIIANRISSQMLLPCIVIAVEKEFSNGSIRAIGNFNAVALLENISNILEQYGGHKNAAGFTIKTENIEEMEERVLKYMENYNINDLKGSIVVDALLESLGELSVNNLKIMENILEPIGSGNELPKLLIKNVKIDSYKKIGKNLEHCQLVIKKSNKSINALFWNGGNIIQQILENNTPDLSFDIIAIPEINSFQGNEEPRLNLIDVRLKE